MTDNDDTYREEIAALYAAEAEAYKLDDDAGFGLILECLRAAGWELVKIGDW